MQGIATRAFAAGMNVVRMNMRNCGGSDALTPTLYHSGRSADVGAVVRPSASALRSSAWRSSATRWVVISCSSSQANGARRRAAYSRRHSLPGDRPRRRRRRPSRASRIASMNGAFCAVSCGACGTKLSYFRIFTILITSVQFVRYASSTRNCRNLLRISRCRRLLLPRSERAGCGSHCCSHAHPLCGRRSFYPSDAGNPSAHSRKSAHPVCGNTPRRALRISARRPAGLHWAEDTVVRYLKAMPRTI